MNTKDNDIEIISESIPTNTSNLLVSGKIKKEKDINKIDLTCGSRTTKSTEQSSSREHNSSNSIEIIDEIQQSTLIDVLDIIQNRKGLSNPSLLSSVPSVNMHEFLKSTPIETFSRKGFYSCAGCSSKFTSSDEYNYHILRQLGEFSYYCDQCKKSFRSTNLCQITIHLLINHKTSNMIANKLSIKSFLTIHSGFNDDTGNTGGIAADAAFEETAKLNMKKMLENQLFGSFNVDLFNTFQRTPKDQRYYLLPMARKEVVQSHKFYSDHFRAAHHKLKDRPVELLHCFMCDFICDTPAELITHLQGDWPNSVNKCAFCNLALPLDKENFCAAKAHVLLHMGIYMMCPRCGFVPPPDLTPGEYEITLRLHLRFVCFHFNSIQIFVCTMCSDNNTTSASTGTTITSGSCRAFNSGPQVMQHIFDDHLQELRLCKLCSVSTTNTNDLPMNSEDMKVHYRQVHSNNQEFEAYWNECKKMGKRCHVCSELIPQKELYYSHVNTQHKSHIIKGTSAFRCFGTCKRIHQSIDEFQQHRPECAQCINVKNRLYQPHLAATNPESISLCFCLYCGIGVRRKKLDNDSYEMQSESQMFTHLDLVHEHEKTHILYETNQTACPWCGLKITAKVIEMTRHMQTHLPDNWFLSWYSKRSIEYYDNVQDVMYCHCEAAIDNPLSLHCHSIPQNIVLQPAPPSSSSSIAAAVVATPATSTATAATTTTATTSTTTTTTTSTINTKHLALTDTIHRELITSSRHRASGTCPLCSSCQSHVAGNQEIFTNTMELSWHIFIKHRVNLCYVCKNYRIINGDNSSSCRVMMWTHIYHCLRRHTPRFNWTNGLELLQNQLANCLTAMTNCTTIDFTKSSELGINIDVNVLQPSINVDVVLHADDANNNNNNNNVCVSSASTECAAGVSSNMMAAVSQDDTNVGMDDEVLSNDKVATNENNKDAIQDPDVTVNTNSNTATLYSCQYCIASNMSLTGRSNKSIIRFDKTSDLQQHLLEAHGVNQTNNDTFINYYLCFVCGVKFDTRDAWEDHSLSEHAKGFHKLGHSLINPGVSVVLDSNYITYRCYLCNHRFEKRNSCENHMITMHSLYATEINWGMLTETNDSSIRRGKTTLNSSKVCVTTCPVKRLKSDLFNPEDPFVCALCPYTCDERDQMLQHGSRWHTHLSLDQSHQFQCPDCSLSFKTSKSRDIHLQFIHSVKPDSIRHLMT